MTWEILTGDCRELLAGLPAGSVHTVITSPPYFGLRDYGTGEWEGGDPACEHRMKNPEVDARTSTLGPNRTGLAESNTAYQHGKAFRDVCGRCGAVRQDRQIGLEATPDEFVHAMVTVFREVRRVLRDDGTVWLNLGDSYAGSPANGWREGSARADGDLRDDGQSRRNRNGTGAVPGVKPKDLIGIPWMVAFALRADGWYLRSDIVWHKPNPMPESVTDRPTRSHEFIFLLTKSSRYFYDADAIREDSAPSAVARQGIARKLAPKDSMRANGSMDGQRIEDAGTVIGEYGSGRNKRDVWTVSTKPYAGAHFATFPPDLIEPCVLAGAPERACSACGAPWERTMEVEPNPGGINGRPGVAYSKGTPETTVGNGEKIAGRHVYRRATETGYAPSCKCYWRCAVCVYSHPAYRTRCPDCDTPQPYERGVVLDPFAGAGTTGLVAVRHKRSFIGLELNPEYAQMARDRIQLDVDLGHRAPQRAPELGPDQLGMFEAMG